MSLATRCTNCGTVFRVVQDQLLVSEGWVRCGRCREVFNAIENMFDLKKDQPPSLPLGPDSQSGHGAGIGRDSIAFRQRDELDEALLADAPEEAAKTARGGSLLSFAESRPSRPPNHPWLDQPGDQVVRTSLWPESVAPEAESPKGADVDLLRRPDVDLTHTAAAHGLAPTAMPSEAHVDHLLASNARDTTFEPYEEPPEFIVRAQKESQWQQPRVRLALRIGAMFLGLALLLQLVMHSRDAIAARWPATEGALQSLCAPFACKVDAPRKLQALKVESATFTESGTAGLYRLNVALLNVDDGRVKMPALDLRLTNPRGEVLARRVLTAAELGQDKTSLDAGQEVTLQGTLRITHPNVNGFDVTVFYP